MDLSPFPSPIPGFDSTVTTNAASLKVLTQPEIKEAISNRYTQLRNEHWRANGGTLEAIQFALDILGLLPGVGVIFDVANAGISFSQGDAQNGNLRLLGALLPIGSAVLIGKTAKAGIAANKTVGVTLDAAASGKSASSAADVCKGAIGGKPVDAVVVIKTADEPCKLSTSLPQNHPSNAPPLSKGDAPSLREPSRPSRPRPMTPPKNATWSTAAGDIVISGDRLPGGPPGLQISRRMTPSELESLTETFNVEFALVYRMGPGKNGGGGQYVLLSGIANEVAIPLEEGVILIYHTHPGGNKFGSGDDMNVLKILQDLYNSPQKSSQVVPVGNGPPTRFTRDCSHYRPGGKD